MPKKRNRYHIKKLKKQGFSRIILAAFLIAGILIIGLIFFNPLVWRLNLRAELEKSKIASTIYDRDGAAIATLYSKTRLWVPINQIPSDLPARFYCY